MQELFNIQIIEPINAPKNVNGKLTFKAYKINDIVQAYVFNQSSSSLNYLEVFKTTDGFTIPQKNAMILSSAGTYDPNQEIQEAEIVTNEQPKVLATTKTMIKGLGERNKYSINGALAGAAVGLIFAMAKQKNKYMYTALGAVAGFAIGNMYAKSIQPK